MSPASYQTAPPRDVDPPDQYRTGRPFVPDCPPTFKIRAGNGTRTRDPNLGKVVLYQLSYSRDVATNLCRSRQTAPLLPTPATACTWRRGESNP